MIGKIITLVAVMSSCTLAISLKEAKRSGQVCEDGRGFVQATVDASDVQSLVVRTNEKRRQKYQEIANQNGTPVDAVAAEAGASLGAGCD